MGAPRADISLIVCFSYPSRSLAHYIDCRSVYTSLNLVGSSIWWSGRVWFIALVLKTSGGDEPPVGSNPTTVAINIFKKILFIAVAANIGGVKKKKY